MGVHISGTSTTRRRSGRWRRVAVVGVVAGLTVTGAACGGDDDSGEGGTGTDGGSGSDSGSGEAGVLRYGVATNVQTFDPQQAAVAQEYYLHPIYDTLVHAQADGTFEGGLAEEYEFVDPGTFELSLREGLTFSDGEALDAAAVVANFERGIDVEASPSALFYANITEAEAVDDLTVRLHLDHPTTGMLADLSRLPGMMMSPAAMDGDPSTDPIGAGGWALDTGASEPGGTQVYRAWDGYWAPERVQVDRVEIAQYEADAAVNALFGGQADIIEASEANRAAIADAGNELLEGSGSNVYYVQLMDTDGSVSEPLGDARVRQALSLGIDRESFNAGLQFGLGNPTPAFWPEDSPYYDEATEDMAFDPDRASELLAEAGYEDGFELTVPSFGNLVPMAESIQQMWGDLGIDVTIDLVEPGTLAAVMRNGTTVLSPTLARGFTAESHYLERLAPGGPYDSIGTDRAELPALADDAMSAETAEEQDAGWRDLYTYAVEEGYIMVIGHQTPTAASTSSVSGAQMLPSDNVPQPYGVAAGG